MGKLLNTAFTYEKAMVPTSFVMQIVVDLLKCFYCFAPCFEIHANVQHPEIVDHWSIMVRRDVPLVYLMLLAKYVTFV